MDAWVSFALPDPVVSSIPICTDGSALLDHMGWISVRLYPILLLAFFLVRSLGSGELFVDMLWLLLLVHHLIGWLLGGLLHVPPPYPECAVHLWAVPSVTAYTATFVLVFYLLDAVCERDVRTRRSAWRVAFVIFFYVLVVFVDLHTYQATAVQLVVSVFLGSIVTLLLFGAHRLFLAPYYGSLCAWMNGYFTDTYFCHLYSKKRHTGR
jgi:hypothetical protein